MGKSSGLAEKSKNRLHKHQEKRENEKEKARDDAVVEISINNILNLRPEEADQTDPTPVSEVEGKAGTMVQVNGDSDEDSGANSEVEEQERRLAEKKRKAKGKAGGNGALKPFTQRDLVSLAFAGDGVVRVRSLLKCGFEIGALYSFARLQDFQEAKQREVREDAPREVDTTLPGWVRSLSTSTVPSHSHPRPALGLMGWHWYEEGTVKTVPRQENRRRRPSFPRRLREGSCYHLRETRQEGCEVYGQGPSIPLYKQGAV